MVKIVESCGNVFADFGFPPGEALTLKLKAALRIDLKLLIQESELSQSQLADKMGISETRIGELMSADFDAFSLNELLAIADNLGWSVDFAIKRKVA